MFDPYTIGQQSKRHSDIIQTRNNNIRLYTMSHLCNVVHIQRLLHKGLLILYVLPCSTFRDALITSSVNCCTSFFSGFVIFMILGYMADLADVDIADVATEGRCFANKL